MVFIPNRDETTERDCLFGFRTEEKDFIGMITGDSKDFAGLSFSASKPTLGEGIAIFTKNLDLNFRNRSSVCRRMTQVSLEVFTLCGLF